MFDYWHERVFYPSISFVFVKISKVLTKKHSYGLFNVSHVANENGSPQDIGYHPNGFGSMLSRAIPREMLFGMITHGLGNLISRGDKFADTKNYVTICPRVVYQGGLQPLTQFIWQEYMKTFA